MSRARLQWVDRERRLREHRLAGTSGPVRIGRHPSCEVCIDDPAVSRHHLLVTLIGDTWFVEAVSGAGAQFERTGRGSLRGRWSLTTGDRIHMAGFTLVYKDEDELDVRDTVSSDDRPRVVLTAKEQQVLECLCRPVLSGAGAPASNEEIRADLFLSADGVRSHLKSVYRKFGLTSGTAAQRRAQLVQRAIADGFVVPL
jgi:DNA-binding CsgD family transcriptional regulator